MGNVRIQRCIRVGLVLVALLMAVGPWVAQASSAPRQSSTIEMLQPVRGRLDDSASEAVYAVRLEEDMVFSVTAFMTATSDVIPQVSVQDPDGEVVALGEPPFAGADSSIVNAALAPETGVYTIHVVRLTGTSGDFTLIVQPGYGYLQTREDFTSYDDDLSLFWEPYIDVNVIALVNNGEMVLQVLTPGQMGFISPGDAIDMDDFYIEAKVRPPQLMGPYAYGLGVRKPLETTEFYSVLINHEGKWSLQYYTGTEWVMIQEWLASDVIDMDEPHPTIGVQVEGSRFRVYFNHQFVGEVVDSEGRMPAGAFALLAIAGEGGAGLVEAHYDDIVITLPDPPPDR